MQVPNSIARALKLTEQPRTAKRPRGKRGKAPRPPHGSKVFLRLHFLQEQRGLELTRIDKPAPARPLEEMRAAIPPAAVAAGEAAVGADSPYVEAYRQLAQMQQPAGGAEAGPAPANQIPEGWRPIGPFSIPHGQTYGSGPTSRPSVSGRISSIAVDPADATHILIGAAGGGVWESHDTGATWTPRTDQQPSLATGAIAFDPSNSQIVYAGTGEGDFYAMLGAGILRSTDGGATWSVRATAPFAGIGFYDIAVDPTNGQHILAATSAGLFESSNGGSTWASRIGQVSWDLSIAPPVGGAITEILAGCANGPQVSTDGGTTWTSIALPGAPARWIRIEVCHAPSDGRVAYIYAVGKGLLSTDPWTGFIWRRAAGNATFDVVPLPAGLNVNQGWYDWCAGVDPSNPDTFYVGGIDLYRGDRTGNNWAWVCISAKTNGDCIHPDQHHVTFSPSDSNVVYASCDGGIYRSPDRGVTWRSLNKGLCITEFEYLAAHPTYDAWLIGGTQDNGTERYEGGEVWTHSQDGDGGGCGIDPSAPATCFHTFYDMGMQRSTAGGSWGTWTSIGPTVPSNYRSLFYPPVAVGSGIVCQAGQSAFISTNSGTSWTEISLPASEVASAAVVASASTLYIGTTSGNIYRINSVAGVWQAPVALTLPRSGYVSDLVVDPVNPSRLWATYSTITGGHVFRSDNGGTIWTDVSGTLPTIPFHSIVVDPAATNTVYVAADVGVYRSTDAGTTWTAFNNGLPNALAADLVFHPTTRLLRVGTRNRGAWEINVDHANMPDVEVYVRDSTVDTGRFTPSPSGPDPFAPPAYTYFWESTDIKVDSPPYQVTNLDDVDFVFFEDDHGVAASGLIHENAERTKTVRVYVQVHNRGIQPATNVDVKVFFASAALGLPDLPTGFWTNFPNNVLPAGSPWQAMAPHRTVPTIECGRPAVVGFNWTVPAGQASHTCAFAVASAQNDSIATSDLNIGNVVLGQQKCALKNLAIVDPAAAPLPLIPLEIWWARSRGRHWIGTDRRGNGLKGVILGSRLVPYAMERRLKRRKVTPDERKQIDIALRGNRHIPPESLDLQNLYIPPVGPWLLAEPPSKQEPDRIIALVDSKIRDRFALIQWDEQGMPVGGFTFEAKQMAPQATGKGNMRTRKSKAAKPKPATRKRATRKT